MYQTKTKTIDKLEVMVTEWPARKAFKMKVKLLKIFGPALAEIISGWKGGSTFSASEIDLSKFSSAIEKLLGSMGEDEFLALVFELMSSTKITNQDLTPEIFDMVFAGRLDSLYKILAMVLEVNFGSFFGASGIGKVLRSGAIPSQPVSQAS